MPSLFGFKKSGKRGASGCTVTLNERVVQKGSRTRCLNYLNSSDVANHLRLNASDKFFVKTKKGLIIARKP